MVFVICHIKSVCPTSKILTTLLTIFEHDKFKQLKNVYLNACSIPSVFSMVP